MTKDEALKLAAIFNLAEKIYKEKKIIPWTEAIEEALAQPDQKHQLDVNVFPDGMPLYARPD